VPSLNGDGLLFVIEMDESRLLLTMDNPLVETLNGGGLALARRPAKGSVSDKMGRQCL